MNKEPREKHRLKKIEVLFSESELAILQAKKSSEGTRTTAKFVRDCVLNRKPQRVQNYAPLVAQLGYIGNNLNQAAAALNFIKKSGEVASFDFSVIENHLSSCAEFIEKIKERSK